MALSKIDTAAIATDAIEAAQLKSDAIAVGDLPTGSVLQVVAGTPPTSTVQTTSTSFVDATGHTVTITPTSSSSKILLLFTARLNNSSGSNASTRGNIRILRGSTEIARRFAGISIGDASPVDRNAYAAMSISILDSPATASATTYKIQLNSDNSTNTISFSGSTSFDESSFVAMEIAA